MAKNPFGGGGKAPKADPNIGRLANVAEGIANEMTGIGRDQLAWSKVMEQARLGATMPAIEEQYRVANEALDRGRQQVSSYQSVYAPNEGIQALDAMGAGWLSTDEQGRLLDAQSAQRLSSLKDAYDSEIAAIRQARARDAASPAGTDTSAAALRYNQAEADAKSRYDREVAGLESQLGYQKELVGASKAAEDAAAGMATADATQAEGRFIAGLGMEAGRMGVDPSRVLASAGARAPSAAAAAAHAGNTARFGFRDQRSQNLANTVQSGRQAAQLGDAETGLGLDALNSAVGNTNATLNSNIAGRSAAAPWYSGGLSGINTAASLLNTQQQQKMAAYDAKQREAGGFMSFLGTLGGAALSNPEIFASSKKLKTDREPADTPDVLDAIEGLSTDSWQYKPGVEDGGRHVGPYAEEMAELGLSDGHKVNAMDTAGLALAGVKQLTKEVRELQAGLEPLTKSGKRKAA